VATRTRIPEDPSAHSADRWAARAKRHGPPQAGFLALDAVVMVLLLLLLLLLLTRVPVDAGVGRDPATGVSPARYGRVRADGIA
jgi:hypothetical protein